MQFQLSACIITVHPNSPPTFSHLLVVGACSKLITLFYYNYIGVCVSVLQCSTTILTWWPHCSCTKPCLQQLRRCNIDPTGDDSNYGINLYRQAINILVLLIKSMNRDCNQNEWRKTKDEEKQKWFYEIVWIIIEMNEEKTKVVLTVIKLYMLYIYIDTKVGQVHRQNKSRQ